MLDVLNNKCQTVTFFGIDREKLLKYIIHNGIIAIDRIVPIGRAANIDIVWDGFNIINMISREISY